ncbi:MAG: DUF3306 domain-containing protein [Polaromonas sp.]|uniref:DUF3306 domain-containing protein n=1 Tax=Polaromonas sp. TaxID=1869339 RepID=UPI0018397336|nr:DUF3306 domain-containing protein [Polaromonas sp.]MBA3595133.1 DUF3306 domain-containing protein [Polaromonas sp.]
MAEGFLGRWSQRKRQVEEGKAVAPEPTPPASPLAISGVDVDAQTLPKISDSQALSPDAQEMPPPLTVQDAQALTPQSDFKPFMAGNVGPDVRNAAMKQLFCDPHFNVMDGLDIYIDDYSKSDPIPESMLRQMASAKFLKLFDEDEEDVEKQKLAAAAPRESAHNPEGESVAQSDEASPPATPDTIAPQKPRQPGSLTDSGASQENHAHTDLRLQPDDAAPGPGAGRGT